MISSFELYDKYLLLSLNDITSCKYILSKIEVLFL